MSRLIVSVPGSVASEEFEREVNDTFCDVALALASCKLTICCITASISHMVVDNSSFIAGSHAESNWRTSSCFRSLLPSLGSSSLLAIKVVESLHHFGYAL